MKWLDRLLKKNNKRHVEYSAVYASTDDPAVDLANVNIRSDIAFKPSISKEVESVRNKIQVDFEDFKEIEFDTDVDLLNYPLSNLSDNAKRAIINIIKQDTVYRINQQPNTGNHKTVVK